MSDGHGFPTPETLPTDLMRRTMDIPRDPDFLGAFTGALMPLMDPANWLQMPGAVTPEVAAAKAQEIILAWLDTETPVP